jgi:hypothetical protein
LPQDRPSIPAEIKRRVLVEAGHRCAIPTCRQQTTEIAHIVSWEKVQKHEFENLIALCPNCHTRYDRGEIDRPAMLRYKEQLAELNVAAFRLPVVAPADDARIRLASWEQESKKRFCTRVHEELKPREDPTRYANGVWSASYALVGGVQLPPLEQLRDLLQRVDEDGTGIPPWAVRYYPQSSPYVFDDVLEAWLGQDLPSAGCVSQFWRVSPMGLLYQVSGYAEDGRSWSVSDAWGKRPEPTPGTVFYWTMHPYRVGQVFAHAGRLARAVGCDGGTIFARFHWEGLLNRRLAVAPGEMFWDTPIHKYCRQPAGAVDVEVELSEIRTALGDVVDRAMKRLFTGFDFTSIPLESINKIVAGLPCG